MNKHIHASLPAVAFYFHSQLSPSLTRTHPPSIPFRLFLSPPSLFLPPTFLKPKATVAAFKSTLVVLRLATYHLYFFGLKKAALAVNLETLDERRF